VVGLWERMTGAFVALVTDAGPLSPLVLFGASFIEYVFPPFPGDLLVVLGAWFAVQGAISWPAAFLAVTAGALAGAAVDHRIGQALGRRLAAGASRRGPLSAERLAHFVDAYQRHGALLLLANRFLPGIRAFLFVAAGAAGLPLGRVLVLGGISAALWNALLLAAGALLARSLDELLVLFRHYDEAAWVALAAATAAGLAGVLWRRSRAAPRGEP
jgi:membrane protein DedA with SNARE-associated domain